MTNQLPTVKRLAAVAASATAALGAVAVVSHTAGAPDALVAATTGALTIGAASVIASAPGRRPEAATE